MLKQLLQKIGDGSTRNFFYKVEEDESNLL